jgi:hypothetical protein
MWNSILEELKKRLVRPQKLEDIPGSERRRVARINMILTLQCTVEGSSEHFRVMTENVNVLGVKYISLNALKKEQNLAIQILVPQSSAPLNLRGRVVWCQEMKKNDRTFYEGGIEFFPLEDDDREFFQRFIDQHTLEAYVTERI